MKPINFEKFLNEGTWKLPENIQIFDNFISEIKKMEANELKEFRNINLHMSGKLIQKNTIYNDN